MKRNFLTLASALSLALSDPVFAEDLSLQVFGPASGLVSPGEKFHYEYNIRNIGPGISEDVTLRDFLPDEVEFISALVDLEHSQGYDRDGCGIFGNNVLWCPIGDVEPTGAVPIFVFVTLRVKSDVGSGVAILNDANINLHDTPDPNPSNNEDQVYLTTTTGRQIYP